MNIALRDVFMDAVVGQEASGGGTVSLRVDVLHVVVDVWQRLRASLHCVLMSDPQFGESGAKLRVVRFGAGEGILQRQDQRRSRGIGFRGWCRRQDLAAGVCWWILSECRDSEKDRQKNPQTDNSRPTGKALTHCCEHLRPPRRNASG